MLSETVFDEKGVSKVALFEEKSEGVGGGEGGFFSLFSLPTLVDDPPIGLVLVLVLLLVVVLIRISTSIHTCTRSSSSGSCCCMRAPVLRREWAMLAEDFAIRYTSLPL